MTRPDWDVVETIVLDMDGTLLDLSFDNILWNELLPRRYGEKHGLSQREAEVEVSARLSAAQGTLEWYCFDHWSREFALDVSALEDEISAHIRLRPGAELFLDWLAGSELRVILATNAHPASLRRKLAATGIARHFDATCSAHDVGSAKEEMDFWAALGRLHTFDAESTILIDDNHNVLRAAQRAGFSVVFGIRRPDSRGPELASSEFVCLDSFTELLVSG